MNSFSRATARNLLNWRWVLFFFAMSFAFWGARPLVDSTEARYGEAARGMVATGHWYIPQLEGRDHITKPAGAYWIIAGGMQLFGNNAWGARFGHAIVLFGTMILVAKLAQTMGLGDDEARGAALVYSTGVYPMVAGHSLSTDLPLLFFVLLGILAYWKVFLGDPFAERWRAVFWFAFGAAFLVKGPPAWLPLLPLVAFSYTHRRSGPPLFFSRTTFVYLPLFLLLSLSWGLAIVIPHPERFQYFFKDEFLERIATTKHKRTEPFWEYPALLLGGLAPWLFCWRQVVAAVRNKWRGGVKTLLPWQAFCLLWIGLVLPVFMASKSKMPLYINGLFVPISCAFGVVVARRVLPWLRATGRLRVATAALGVWAVVLCAISVAENPFGKPRHHRELGHQLAQLAPTLPAGTKYFFVEGQARYSLSFYSGIVIPEARKPDKKHVQEQDFKAFHRELVATGSHPVYVTQTSHMAKFLQEAGVTSPPKVLLKDFDLSVYTVEVPGGS